MFRLKNSLMDSGSASSSLKQLDDKLESYDDFSDSNNHLKLKVKVVNHRDNQKSKNQKWKDNSIEDESDDEEIQDRVVDRNQFVYKTPNKLSMEEDQLMENGTTKVTSKDTPYTCQKTIGKDLVNYQEINYKIEGYSPKIAALIDRDHDQPRRQCADSIISNYTYDDVLSSKGPIQDVEI